MRNLPLLALAAALAIAQPAIAQEPQAPPQAPPPHARRGNGDFKELGLTPDQKQKLRDLRQQYPNDPKARHKAAMEVLTPEQRDKLRESRRHRKEMRRAPQADPH